MSLRPHYLTNLTIKPIVGFAKANPIPFQESGSVDLSCKSGFPTVGGGPKRADENFSYENEAALVETHRSGAEYQRMRKVVAEEELLGKTYPQIIFLKPAAPSGFINRGSTATVLDESDQSLVLISQYKYRAESMQPFLAEIEHMTQACRTEPKVLAYYPMLRKDGESSVLTIFERYASENAHRKIKEALDPLLARLAALSDEIVVTTWGHGFGHLKSISSNLEL
ncbi:uncharacterized protein A1O5_13123 [Cladophialophora psammophila CBS 110553]|uniref:ABM domain-containing protein n=1 Tax=Cladophialophora psammophila CBS 110553 TaxID=1182543 RepID=W9VNG3_9EURO|nr:uncharacterized protein A1O5_13123 [Cladophialophora psammophila CBS 110553]EXJ53671.1 hypothetical protein A1O5_13123 [Cladophialophora psammophila CBS 110553]